MYKVWSENYEIGGKPTYRILADSAAEVSAEALADAFPNAEAGSWARVCGTSAIMECTPSGTWVPFGTVAEEE